MPRLLYPSGKGPGTALNDIEKLKFLTLPGLGLEPLSRPASRYTTDCPEIVQNSRYFSVLFTIIRTPRDELTGRWRKLHNEELRDLYSLPSIIRMFKSRRMRWARRVSLMREEMKAHRKVRRENNTEKTKM
jgi:hypothetical protein